MHLNILLWGSDITAGFSRRMLSDVNNPGPNRSDVEDVASTTKASRSLSQSKRRPCATEAEQSRRALPSHGADSKAFAMLRSLRVASALLPQDFSTRERFERAGRAAIQASRKYRESGKCVFADSDCEISTCSRLTTSRPKSSGQRLVGHGMV